MTQHPKALQPSPSIADRPSEEAAHAASSRTEKDYVLKSEPLLFLQEMSSASTAFARESTRTSVEKQTDAQKWLEPATSPEPPATPPEWGYLPEGFDDDPSQGPLEPPVLPDDDGLLFDVPTFVKLPLDPQRFDKRLPTTTIPPHRTFYFRRNYRRFVLFLFFALVAASPLVYLMLARTGLVHPIRWTLFSITGLWGLSSGLFVLGSYRRRAITVDQAGISYQDELRSLYITWPEVDSIHLHAVEAFFNPYPLCYVRVVSRSGEEFAFANYGNHLFGTQRSVSFGSPPYPIIDVRDADLLLALLVQQARHTTQAPDLERLRYRAQSELDPDEEISLKPFQKKDDDGGQSQFVGLWALFGKIGLKWLPQSAKFLLQTVKPGYVGLSVGLYAIFFQWQFALVLALLLIGHELGHVWAMYRAGMRIRGVYLIPFFGAATVTEDTWPSWASLARVSLAGPLWGTYLTALCFCLYLIFPTPFWLLATLLGALLNLLNLLPVQPLDGGRILNAVAYSLRTSTGLALTLSVLAGTIVLSLSLELLLLYILSAIGIAEFFREYMFRQRADKLALLRDKDDVSGRDLVLLKSITGINFGLNNALSSVEREQSILRRLRMMLHAPPMTPAQILHIGLSSVMVAAALFGFLLLLAYIHPSTHWAIDLLR